MIEVMLEDYNYVVLNTGRPTYQKFTGGMSHIDLALVNSNIAAKCNWNVLNNTMGSDHCPTVVAYNEPVYSEAAGLPRWKVKHVDWQRYKGSSRTYITSDLIIADSDTFNNRIIEAINKSAESSIPHTKPGKKTKYRYLPYWNRKCKEAILNRNRARNKINRSNKLDDTIEYRRLKGIAQFTEKSTAKEYWHSYCNTLYRSTKLSSVWRMAKKMNGVNTTVSDITLVGNSQQVHTNTDKAEFLAKTFSEVSSDANYTHTFLTHKTDIEINHTHLFTHITNTSDKYPELNQPFSFNELCNALQQSRKHSSAGEDGMLRNAKATTEQMS